MDEKSFNRMARDILESLYYFIAIDCEERITFIGREYASYLGYAQEELIGRPVREVIPNTRLPKVLKDTAEISSRLAEKFVIVTGTADGGDTDYFEDDMLMSLLGECAMAIESIKNSREKEEAAQCTRALER